MDTRPLDSSSPASPRRSSGALLLPLAALIAVASPACGSKGSTGSAGPSSSSSTSGTTSSGSGGATTSTSASSSGTTGPGTGGNTAGVGGAGGSTAGTGGAGGGQLTTSSSSSAASTSSAAASSSGSSGGDAGACDLSGLLGGWTVATYACGNGPATPLPSGFSFSFTLSGNPENPTGTFVQDNFGFCINSDTGTVSCDGTYMGLPAIEITQTAPQQCQPANCLGMSQCGQIGPPIYYTYQLGMQNGMPTLTTVTLPNTPLTTCTSQGKQNPITFVWVPM